MVCLASGAFAVAAGFPYGIVRKISKKVGQLISDSGISDFGLGWQLNSGLQIFHLNIAPNPHSAIQNPQSNYFRFSLSSTSLVLS